MSQTRRKKKHLSKIKKNFSFFHVSQGTDKHKKKKLKQHKKKEKSVEVEENGK